MYKAVLVFFAIFFGSIFGVTSAQSANQNVFIPALVTNGGTLHSFSEAVNLPLTTDADFGRFVDPQITGANRALAISLLRIMPQGMRGDFTYVDKFGHIFSNRLSVANGVRFASNHLPAAVVSNRSLANTRIRPALTSRVSGSLRPNSYPPTGGSGGAYIRNYSFQGINAAYGYATPPCDVNLPTDPFKDSGNMYFNAYDSNGSDVVDAGIGANNVGTSNIPGFTAQQVLTAFITPYQSSGWHNQSQQWPCGSPLGLMYGTLPSPNQNLSMLAVGIPSFDPTQLNLPPASTTWTSSAWNFFPTNGALLAGAGTWNGIPSNCTACSVARMTTIGQQNPVPDNSCYGYCGSTPDARWDEVVMGELIAPCVNSGSTATCTIEFASNGSWLGGENDTNLGVSFDDPNNQQALEGINLSTGAGVASRSRAPNSKFRSLPLPTSPSTSCPPDSHGYCSSFVSTTDTGVCVSQGVGGKPISHSNYKQQSYVFQGKPTAELLATVVKTVTYSGTYCAPSTSWSPWDPAVHYNDPLLP